MRQRQVRPCRRPIKMSLLCQIEMTLPGGFAELAYEASVLKRARSNNGSGFVGWCIGRRASAALCRGSAPARRPTPTIVTSLSGGHTSRLPVQRLAELLRRTPAETGRSVQDVALSRGSIERVGDRAGG